MEHLGGGEADLENSKNEAEFQEPGQDDQTTIENAEEKENLTGEDDKITPQASKTENEVIGPSAENVNQGQGEITRSTLEGLEEKMNTMEIAEGAHGNKEAAPGIDEKKKLTVISKYLSMAIKGKESQALLLKDSEICQFLILCLMDDSVPVVIAAMDVFEVLFCNRRNHATLLKLPYLKDMIRRISKNSKLDTNVRQDAKKMLKTLEDVKAPLGEQSNAARNNNSYQNPGPAKKYRQSENATNNKLNISKQNALETTLFLDHRALQQKIVQVKVTAALIKVKGIISITYDLNKNYCIIRQKRHVSPDDFAIAVANLGYQVSLVCKNEKKEPVLIPVSVERKDNSMQKENMPQYLPEDDVDLSIGDMAIKRATGDKKNENEGSWIDSTKNFLRNSFYW